MRGDIGTGHGGLPDGKTMAFIVFAEILRDPVRQSVRCDNPNNDSHFA
jgi:hypothetical protein